MKKILSRVILLFLFFSFEFSLVVFSNNELLNKNCSLDTVIQKLGFCEEKQKSSFKRLCSCAGVELPDNFDTKLLLELVMKTQRAFTNRKDKQERWEITPLDWMKNNPQQYLQDIKTLGFTDDVLPKSKKYGAVCILGAVNSTMKYRMKFIEKLVDSGFEVSRIFLLSGERYVSHVDGSDEEILGICQKFNVSKENLTEAHLIQNIFDDSILSKNYKSILIDTPSYNGSRPTTKTTVKDFCKWVKENNFEDDVLFVSSQPNIFYQESIISKVLNDEDLKIKFEVVGPKTGSLDIQTLVGAMGSYLWAIMPKIISEFGFDIKSPEEVKMFKTLYGCQL